MRLRHFMPAEFREWDYKTGEYTDWWPLMSHELLCKLDAFREELGVPVSISPAHGAIGRRLGMTSYSQHNVDMWGEVRAVDVMPFGSTMQAAYDAADKVGFTGVGVYPDWQPRAGLHLDVREGDRARWAGVKRGGEQIYVALSEVVDDA